MINAFFFSFPVQSFKTAAGNTQQEVCSEVTALVIARPLLSSSLNLCQDTVHLQTCQRHRPRSETHITCTCLNVKQLVWALCCWHTTVCWAKWRLSQQNPNKLCYRVVKWPHVSLLSLYSQFTSWPPQFRSRPSIPSHPSTSSTTTPFLLIHYSLPLEVGVCVCVGHALCTVYFLCACVGRV